MINEYEDKQHIFRQAAERLFHTEADKLKQIGIVDGVSLNPEQITTLVEKIRLLPEDWQDALLLYYCYGFDIDLSGELTDDPDIYGKLLYARDTLAFSMAVSSIAEDSFIEACRLVIQDLHKQVKLGQQDIPITASRKMDRKIHSLFRKPSKGGHMTFYLVAKRAAIIFLALLAVSSATVLSVEALRTRFFDWLFSVFPTHTRIEFTDVNLPSNMESIQMNQFAPTNLPDGFTLVDTVETDINFKLYYANSQDQYIIFEVRSVGDQDHIAIDTEDNDIEAISINGNLGHYVNGDPSHVVFWSNKTHFFTVICDTNKNDATKVAESTNLK